MTRCEEFYEKLERDGNFCGMREQDFREALAYFKSVEKDKNGKPLLSCGAWIKEQREQAKKATPTEKVPNEDPEELSNEDPEEVPDNTPTEDKDLLYDMNMSISSWLGKRDEKWVIDAFFDVIKTKRQK